MKLLVSAIWETIAAAGYSTEIITTAGVLFLEENDLDGFPGRIATLLDELKKENEAKLLEKSGRRCRVSLRLISHSVVKL